MFDNSIYQNHDENINNVNNYKEYSNNIKIIHDQITFLSDIRETLKY